MGVNDGSLRSIYRLVNERTFDVLASGFCKFANLDDLIDEFANDNARCSETWTLSTMEGYESQASEWEDPAQGLEFRNVRLLCTMRNGVVTRYR